MGKPRIDSDRLFKELITNYFPDFIDLFFPEASVYLDPASVVLLDKEVFTDVTSGSRHEVDLVARVRFRRGASQGREGFFLVHVETQASRQEHFPKRMFRYFARLHEKYDLPVYPIAVFSYDTPRRKEPASYAVTFPDAQVLRFSYRVVQLNRLDWRAFVEKRNPVAAALMAKMRIDPHDRPRVKLEILRLLATLKLNPAKMQLISGFVDSYLRLTRKEMNSMHRQIKTITPAEQEKVTLVMNEWEELGWEKGMESGLEKGERDLVLRQLRSRFGRLPAAVQKSIEALSSKRVGELGEALLDFTELAEVRGWLTKHR